MPTENIRTLRVLEKIWRLQQAVNESAAKGSVSFQDSAVPPQGNVFPAADGGTLAALPPGRCEVRPKILWEQG
jgi:hypothetical protein